DQIEKMTEANLAQREYDANAGNMQARARVQGSGQQLGQQGEQAGIAHTQAETRNLQQNVPLLQQQRQFLDKVRTLKEQGKYGSDQDLFNSVLPEAAT